MSGNESVWLTPAQAAEHLKVNVGTLKYWRRTNVDVDGPPYSRVKTIVRYRRKDLDDWLAKYRVAS